MCLGRVFGQQQIIYTLVRIFQDFERIEPISGQIQQFKLQLNTIPAHPIKCIFTRGGKVLHNLRKFKIMAIANRFTVSLSVVRMWALL
jgi:hypothetical protein